MKSILLIEDDPFLVDIYKVKFKDAGFTIDTALDGEEGLRKAETGKFDLLILDIVLPGIDGWEFLQRVSQNQNLKNLKIVVLSNLGQKEEIEKGAQLGVAKYLIKSHHTPSEVIKEVSKLLQ